MEKYKLLKDLPNAKAGEIFELKENGSLLFQGSDKSAGVFYKKEEVIVFDLLNPDKGWFKKIEEKKYGGRVLKNGDTFYYISTAGAVIEGEWLDGGVCESMFECNNGFWTEEEAKKELARRKAYVILKEDTKGFKPDWKRLDIKWFVGYFRSLGGRLRPDWTQRDSAEVLYFSSMEDAEASIEAHRQQWLDYLCIEEEE